MGRLLPARTADSFRQSARRLSRKHHADQSQHVLPRQEDGEEVYFLVSQAPERWGAYYFLGSETPAGGEAHVYCRATENPAARRG